MSTHSTVFNFGKQTQIRLVHVDNLNIRSESWEIIYNIGANDHKVVHHFNGGIGTESEVIPNYFEIA